MEAARNAIHKITSRTGHTTEVDERVLPAVTSETVKPHRHEETTQAVDREVHQDHYHTTVQPIAHKEVLPEKHHHVQAPTIEKEYKHDDGETHRRVSAELAQFKNTSTTHETSTSRSAAPTVTGEHVHHHVHETVQPVIHKETVQPEVVHTTVPVHEIHHQGAQHHGVSALPMKTLDEFKSIGGLSGTGTTHETYEGAPRPYNDKFTTKLENVLPGHHHSSTTGVSGTSHTTGTSGISGTHGTSGTSGLSGTHGTHDNHGTHGTTGALGTIGTHDRSRDGYSNTDSHSTRPDSGYGANEKHAKPSLADKLNPKVDADGDGKAGFMS